MPYNPYSLVRNPCALWIRTLYSFVIIIVIGVALSPTIGVSQTEFAWPDSRVDVSKYESLETCEAMVRRVTDSVYVHNDAMSDTLPWLQIVFERRQVYVQTIAQRCLARFPVSDVPLDKYLLAQRLYLLAGRDADATAMINRRLAAIPSADSAQRATVLESIIRVYFGVLPIRMDAIRPLVDQFGPLGYFAGWGHWFSIYHQVMTWSNQLDRNDWVLQYRQEILASYQKYTDTMTSTLDQGAIRMLALAADKIFYHQALMDSLRKSTATYAQMQEKLRKSYFGDIRFGEDPFETGLPAPEVHADFIFPDSAKHDRLPRPGKVSLIVTRVGDQRGSTIDFSENIRIRRIKQQFPELDIVFITSTAGVIAPLAPPPPAEEAALFNTMLLDFEKLPVTLVVMNRPYFHVAGPDQRRVNLPIEGEWKPDLPKSRAILIDRKGTVVDEVSIGWGDERPLTELIQIVLGQQK